ncbi:MAG: hypothetical protein WCA35_10255 [Kovacikia sp.]
MPLTQIDTWDQSKSRKLVIRLNGLISKFNTPAADRNVLAEVYLNRNCEIDFSLE